jgi:release factor glutamine methyltransferase
MLPTPSTSHLSFDRIYEPAEDSFLLLDTLSSPSESSFLSTHFAASPSPLITEIGTGSGVVLAFLTAHALQIFGRADILSLGIDINSAASAGTAQTVAVATAAQIEHGEAHGCYLGNGTADLTAPLRRGMVDVLVFNPPYVPSPDVPSLPGREVVMGESKSTKAWSFEEDSALLALSYAGGKDGMEVTDRLLEEIPEVLSARGVAYVLLCAQNFPDKVKYRIRGWEGGRRWQAETVGSSGMKAGWEKLVIVRIWRA